MLLENIPEEIIIETTLDAEILDTEILDECPEN